MKNWIFVIGAALALSACAQKSAYEAAVEDHEPRYCYRSIGGVVCYAKPYEADERRLVNYYGPAPIRYEKADPVEPQRLIAPEPIAYWVKDPEPVPMIAIKGDLADRPWLTKDPVGGSPLAENKDGLNAFMRNFDQKPAQSPVPVKSKPNGGWF